MLFSLLLIYVCKAECFVIDVNFLFASTRLVNGVVEKTREKNKISIGEAADAIGIPRMLIDIRHGSSEHFLSEHFLILACFLHENFNVTDAV